MASKGTGPFRRTEELARAWLYERGLRAPGEGQADDGESSSDADARRQRRIHDAGVLGTRTPLARACEEGNLPVAAWLLEKGSQENVRRKDVQGNSPLLLAARGGHLNTVKLLYSRGAHDDISRPDDRGYTAMHHACFLGHLKLVQWLLDRGASTTLRAENCHGSTPVRTAFYYKRVAVVKWLIRVGVWRNATEASVRHDTDLRDSRLRDMIYRQHIARMRELLQWAGNFHNYTSASAFFTFLCGTYNGTKACRLGSNSSARKGSPHLWILNGHGGYYKRRIFDLLSPLMRAEELRNLQEAAGLIQQILKEEERWRLRPEHLGLGPNFGCSMQ